MKNELGINYLNVSCEEIFDVVKWKDAKVFVSLVVLAFINVAVIVGNCLVREVFWSCSIYKGVVLYVSINSFSR